MTLTERQRIDLYHYNIKIHVNFSHYSIVSYLQSNGFSKTANIFIDETKLDTQPHEKYNNLLEKKWNTVIRLQKKVLDLEAKLSESLSEMNSLENGPKKSITEWLPRPPAIHTLINHRSSITRVVFHPKCNQCASASQDSTIKLWDFESGEYEHTMKGHMNTVQDLKYNNTGSNIVSCSSDLTIKLWDTNTYQCIKTFRGHDHNISSVDYTPNFLQIVSASRDKTIKIWDVSTGYCVQTVLSGHNDWIRMARVCQDGVHIASCSNDKTIRVWSLESNSLKNTLVGHTHVIECIEWAPTNITKSINPDQLLPTNNSTVLNGYLVSGSRDKTIRIWDIGTSQCLFQLNGHDDWVRQMCFQTGGGYLLSCSDDKNIKIWDLRNRRCVKTLEAHEHFVSTIAIHSQLPYVITGSVDKSIKVWKCR
ncbi:hypothetical protein A3Q56_07884 [Intoshia linei]|uniref:Lissencephaly-1 homolog n=1 Tax=Intoshia linei TaxID=1819745 RepID=A0A177AT41_9BILA|nr:hypothetical protein A3Q56_07884 [Intoshia linei]